MRKIPLDLTHPDVGAVRLILLEWLREHPGANALSRSHTDYAQYADLAGGEEPAILTLILPAFWELVLEGIVIPGKDLQDSHLTWFHLTEYGHRVLNDQPPDPYDPEGYLAHLRTRISAPDSTVLAYLAESLSTFRRGSFVAAAVMLGIAAERVFLLLCQSIEASLADPKEKKHLSVIMSKMPVKPKLDWVLAKFQRIQATRPTGFPENATIMVLAIYDVIRTQRNDLGHPKEAPPQMNRRDVYASLQIFSAYYEVAEDLRGFLDANQI